MTVEEQARMQNLENLVVQLAAALVTISPPEQHDFLNLTMADYLQASSTLGADMQRMGVPGFIRHG